MNGKKSKQLKREARKLIIENNDKVLLPEKTIQKRLKKMYNEGKINVTRD